jgi:hypothetical protein
VLNDNPAWDSEAGIEIAAEEAAGGPAVLTYASHILDTELGVDYIVAFADVSQYQGRPLQLTITLRQTDVCGGTNCTHNVDLYVGDLWFERLPDICTTLPDGSHMLYDYYDDPSPLAIVGCSDPQAYYFIDVEEGPHNGYGAGEDDYAVAVDLPAGTVPLQFKVYYGFHTHGFAINGHALTSQEVDAAFPIHKGTYVNIAEPSRWMPVNDNPDAVRAWLIGGQNRFEFDVYAQNLWEERPFDLWARFRAPSESGP